MNVWGALDKLMTFASENAPSSVEELVRAVGSALASSDSECAAAEQEEESAAVISVQGGTEQTPVRAGNPGTIFVDGTDEHSRFDFFKEEVKRVMEDSSNRHLCTFAMAALDESEHGEAFRQEGRYAVLTNDGVIHMTAGELMRQYGPLLMGEGDEQILPGGKRRIREDSGKKYFTTLLWGMLAGEYSRLVNNGRIIMECDFEDKDRDKVENFFFHSMYTSNRSAMVNNGEILFQGKGSIGSNPRGITSFNSDISMTNNGRIVVDVETAMNSRLLTSTGFGCTLLNRGLLYCRASGPIFGMTQAGSSTILNEGVIDITTTGVNADKKVGFVPTSVGAYAITSAGGDFQMEAAADKIGLKNWRGGGVRNAGVIHAAVEGGASDPKIRALGIRVTDAERPYEGYYTVSNTGVIRTASDAQPCKENGFLVRRAELAVNPYTTPKKSYAAKIRLREWATDLRDFAQCRDFFQAASDSDEPVLISFEEAELILRPPQNYTAGTAYQISAETLVTPLDAETLEKARVQVTGMEHMKIRTEMSDFLVPSVEETARDDYQVSLKLADNPQAQRQMLASAVMAPVDFMRANMEALEQQLADGEALDWSGAAYSARHSREDGLSGQIQGFIGGKDFSLGSLFRVGVHGGLAKDAASGGIYHGTADMCAAMRGVHVSLGDGALRAQATAFHTLGGTAYALHTDTGIQLDGKSDGNLDGVCASAQLRKRLQIGRDSQLYAEAGVSCLRFQKGTSVDWSFKEEELPGYRMESDPVQSVRGHFQLGWKSLFGGGKDGQASVSLKGSAALKDSGAGLRMLNDTFQETIREDPVQLSLTASLKRRIGGWHLNLGFHSSLGKKSRLGLLRISLRHE